MFATLNKSVGMKIAVIPVMATLAFIFYLGYSAINQNDNAARLKVVQNELFPLAQEAIKAEANLERVVEELASAVSAGDETMLDEASSRAGDLAKQLAFMLSTAEHKPPIQAAQQHLNNYLSSAISLSRSMIDGSADFARLGTQVETMQSALETARTSLQEIRKNSEVSLQDHVETSLSNHTAQLWVGIGIIALTIAILSWISWRIISQLTGSINEVTRSLQDFATGRGNLSDRISCSSNDEIATLVDNFNSFVGELHDTISQVIATLEPLNGVTSKLDQSSNSFLTLAEQQNTSADSAALATESMVSGVNTISVTATSSAELAKEVGIGHQRRQRAYGTDRTPYRYSGAELRGRDRVHGGAGAGNQQRRQHYRSDLRHRGSDQPAGPERHHRSGQGGQTGQRLCGCRR